MYKRLFIRTLLRCLREKEIKQALQTIHEGIYVTHVNGHTMARQIQRFGYFWLNMKRDYVDYVRKFLKC